MQARNEEEAFGMLNEWRLSMRGRAKEARNWSCPKCAEYWQDPTPTTTDTAGSAGQIADAADAAATPFDALKLEVVELKAEVVELKAEVERLRCEILARGLEAASAEHA